MSRSPHQIVIETSGQANEEQARHDAWKQAMRFADAEDYASVFDLRLVSEGYRLDDEDDWSKTYVFEAVCS